MLWIWIGFFVLIFGLLALDLGVFNRRAHEIGLGEAVGWTAFWIVLSLLFNLAIYFLYGHHWLGAGLHERAGRIGGAEAAVEFFTGYLIEKSLSVDNIFVIALIFRTFNVSPRYQHRVLFWGILGAMMTRGAMIGAGIWLIERFEWIFYVFGGLLIISAMRILFAEDRPESIEHSRLVRWTRRILPVTNTYRGGHFTIVEDGKRFLTPLMLVLIVIELTDVLFALDSIPAIFAITTDPFIVLTSNVFAILGLRSLYFVLARVIERFRYINLTLTVILVMVGVKMLLHEIYPIPNLVSLVFIATALVLGIIASVWVDRRDARRTPRET